MQHNQLDSLHGENTFYFNEAAVCVCVQAESTDQILLSFMRMYLLKKKILFIYFMGCVWDEYLKVWCSRD